jgi:hypothetical protein
MSNQPKDKNEQEKGDIQDSEDLKLHLLNLSKEILHYKASMRWETDKETDDISIESIIAGAEKMHQFVKEAK